MIATRSFCRGVVAVALLAAAIELEPKSKYRIHPVSTAEGEKACLAKIADHLGKVEGLNKVSHPRPFHWKSRAIKEFEFFLYSGVVFQSSYSDVEGAVVCATHPSSRTLIELNISFQGKGLAGFKPLKPNQTRAEARRNATGAQTPTSY